MQGYLSHFCDKSRFTLFFLSLWYCGIKRKEMSNKERVGQIMFNIYFSSWYSDFLSIWTRYSSLFINSAGSRWKQYLLVVSFFYWYKQDLKYTCIWIKNLHFKFMINACHELQLYHIYYLYNYCSNQPAPNYW